MTAPRRILVVEDEEDVSRYLAAALEDEGYEVETAFDAVGGLKAIGAQQPDLVCLDIVMPGPTGLSLYREIRENSNLAGMPIVVVSGLNPADAEATLGFGETLPPPDAYIEKPVDIQELINAVGRLIAVQGK
jgi:DNA-binding response OmpR family regulator